MVTVANDRHIPADAIRRAILESRFLRSLAAARQSTHQSKGLRALTKNEILTLGAQHNAAADWENVWVAQEFNPHKVVGCYFSGEVRLGVFREKVEIEAGIELGSGIYNCDLHNVSVGDNALLVNTSLIANYHIGAGAVVQGCGRVVCTRETLFGNGQKISLGLETPGRETGFFAEMTVEVAAKLAGHRKLIDQLAAYDQALDEYLKCASSKVGVIEPGAVIQNVPKIMDTYVGFHARLDAATSLENSTILSSPEEAAFVASGACIKDSIVQWGCRIETHALVENSICCEHSFVDSHGKLSHSLLGPNSGVSGGECLHSLVGPFVGFHHQSLLVAAYWPEGKGNIGYGANIGSNHTGKAPDQEIWPGEGTFFGLGVNIKFPADYSKAPYSIIATGVSTLPQRVEMPFSLINARAESIEGVSPAFNEILPGWVLSDNIYMVRRNERKYAIRNKASRAQCGFEVFRPEIVDMMAHARAALQQVTSSLTPAQAAQNRPHTQMRPVYTDKDIPGLGKNFMKETARLEGIDAYTFYIRLYALKGLLFAVKFCLQQDLEISGVLEPGLISDPRYEHELKLILSEYPGKAISELLGELVVLHEKMAADTLLSKEKDDFRGVRIVPDYAEVHPPAKEDRFVKITLREAHELKLEVDAILMQIK